MQTDELIEYLKTFEKKQDLPMPTKNMLNFFVRELMIFANFEKVKEENYEKAQNVYKNKLHIGCGKNYLDDFVNLDIDGDADIIWDVRVSMPFKDDSFLTIFSEHFLEHIDFPESVNVFLSEAFRVLKNNSNIVIGVPDTKKILEAHAQNDEAFFLELINRWYSSRDCTKYMQNSLNCINYHMRDQLHHAKYSPHLWGYDEHNLKELLEEHGFTNIRKWEINNAWVNKKRVWGSFYLIGDKNVK